MKRVLTFGTFDMLHPGHLSYLKQAKSFGDHLTVIVARDDTIKRLRGRLPAINEKDRLELVCHLDLVDDATLGSLGDWYALVKDIRPDIICLGYDQAADEKKLTSMGFEVVRLHPFMDNIYKSSKLKQNSITD